uniref:Serine/threonine-protein kinase SMU1 (EC) n=1 Tax=Ganoderma boninense TaxID=34458 RepID=A0A5K1K1G9_9APHY|nr:Serine/threonine-protein kinase SMU1 (EC [Ganoderma boninense]
MYHYHLHADNLTPVGAVQTYELEQLAFKWCHDLVDDDNIPFVCESGTSRSRVRLPHPSSALSLFFTSLTLDPLNARRYSSALAVVQGVGYVNELLTRRTGMPVRDHKTYNAACAFRLGHTLSADFAHEDLMASVFPALGLFNVGYHSHLGVGCGRSAEEGKEDGQWWIVDRIADGAVLGVNGHGAAGVRTAW